VVSFHTDVKKQKPSPPPLRILSLRISSPQSNQPICRDFQNGRCFRTSCRFHHGALSDPTSPAICPPVAGAPFAPPLFPPAHLDALRRAARHHRQHLGVGASPYDAALAAAAAAGVDPTNPGAAAAFIPGAAAAYGTGPGPGGAAGGWIAGDAALQAAAAALVAGSRGDPGSMATLGDPGNVLAVLQAQMHHQAMRVAASMGGGVGGEAPQNGAAASNAAAAAAQRASPHASQQSGPGAVASAGAPPFGGDPDPSVLSSSLLSRDLRDQKEARWGPAHSGGGQSSGVSTYASGHHAQSGGGGVQSGGQHHAPSYLAGGGAFEGRTGGLSSLVSGGGSLGSSGVWSAAGGVGGELSPREPQSRRASLNDAPLSRVSLDASAGFGGGLWGDGFGGSGLGLAAASQSRRISLNGSPAGSRTSLDASHAQAAVVDASVVAPSGSSTTAPQGGERGGGGGGTGGGGVHRSSPLGIPGGGHAAANAYSLF